MSAEPVRQEAAPAEMPRILVVDDVPMFVELESLFLAPFGRVRAARSGAEALDVMATTPIDVAVVDFRLPDITGDVLCGRLRERAHDPTLPVVLVSSGDPEEHALAVRAGASDVISKPLSRRSLVGAVSRMLEPGGPRGLPRIEVDAPARLEGPERSVEGRISNLSRGGVFVQAEWFPPEGTEVTIAFTLPEQDLALRPTATTVWRQLRSDRGAPGLGMRFVDLDGSTLNALEGYVHERWASDSSRSETSPMGAS